MKESKTSLTTKVAQSTEWPRANCEIVINQFVDYLVSSLIDGKEVEIRGLGVFSQTRTKERKRINPRTKEKLLQPPQTLIKFRVSSRIKEAINANGVPREN